MPSEIRITREWLDRRLREIDEAILRLQTERDILAGWQKNPPGPTRPVSRTVAVPVEWTGPEPADGKPKPSEAIDALLAEKPGLTRREIVNRLADKVASEAKNVRVVLYTALKRRESEGKIVRGRRDRLYPAGHPDVVGLPKDGDPSF